MIQKVPNDSESDLLWLQSLCSFDNLAEPYLQDIKQRDPVLGREIQTRTQSVFVKVLEQSNRLSDMVRHFRSLETSPETSKKNPVYDSVYQVLRAMQYEFPLEKITILKIIPHDLTPPPIPKNHLEMILFHLLLNAKQSVGDAAGIVTIEAANQLSLAGEKEETGNFVLRVSDTGPGIPEQHVKQVFDPFFSTENLCRLNGVGLCLVHKIAGFYKGSVRVQTSLMGTSYYVEFPRA